jgi:hypothetical protein
MNVEVQERRKIDYNPRLDLIKRYLCETAWSLFLSAAVVTMPAW